MTKKNRLIIFFICAILFLIITPYIILYSFGYRIDVKTLKIVAMGGIYVHALPSGANVTVDGKINDTTGIFSQAVFIQNLLPQTHTILITKDGYYDYQKSLDVKERAVTKLENVQLFKKNIEFNALTDPVKNPFLKPTPKDLYAIKNNNLYLTIAPTIKATLIIKNIATYTIIDNTIVWLGLDGFLHRSDLQGKIIEKLTQTSIGISKENSYEIIVLDENIFLKENKTVLFLNLETKSFHTFYSPVNTIKISPDGQKIIYYNDRQIFISSLVSDHPQLPKLATGILLQNVTEQITDAYWLNDDYIILNAGDNIIISEIDIRNNINSITLPQTISPISKISFDQQEKKLYILTGTQVLVSEKLVP